MNKKTASLHIFAHLLFFSALRCFGFIVSVFGGKRDPVVGVVRRRSFLRAQKHVEKNTKNKKKTKEKRALQRTAMRKQDVVAEKLVRVPVSTFPSSFFSCSFAFLVCVYPQRKEKYGRKDKPIRSKQKRE